MTDINLGIDIDGTPEAYSTRLDFPVGCYYCEELFEVPQSFQEHFEFCSNPGDWTSTHRKFATDFRDAVTLAEVRYESKVAYKD